MPFPHRRRRGVLGGALALACAAVSLAAAAAGAGGTPRWTWPAGRAAPRVPADNAMSAAKVELGRRLFYDADLSADGSMACATCHVQRHGFADGNATHAGVHGDPGRRNVPGLANIAWAGPLTWADPRVRTLEAQVPIPVTGLTPVEMGMHGQEAEIARRLAGDPCYGAMFRRAFPETRGWIDMVAITRALAAFERIMVSDHAPYDRWRAGDRSALGVQARRGLAAFRLHCAGCHAGPDLSDGRFHAILPPSADRGLAEVSGKAGDAGRFRTPPLRNVALTAPYFHDGSVATLAMAIDRHGLPLASGARDDMLAFLDALTDRDFLADPRLSLPQSACGRSL